MLFEAALTELGLPTTASSDDVRRAYLRLLKTRKPETDPEGFKRLREAFELAKGEVAFREKMRAARVEAEEEAEASTKTPDLGDADARTPPPVAEPPTPIVADGSKVAAVAEDAAPLRGSPVLSRAEIEKLAADGKYKESARAVIHAFAEAETRPELTPPHEHFVLSLGFRLVENRSLNTAKRLETAFQRWLEYAGPRSAMSGVFVAVWSLYRDLVSIAETLSNPVRRAVAKTLRDPSLAATLEAAGEDDWASVQRDAFLLRERTPSLFNVVGPRLVLGAERGRLRAQGGGGSVLDVAPSKAFPRWVITLPIFALLTLLRVASRGGCNGSSSYSPSYSSPPIAYTPAAPSDPYEKAVKDFKLVGILTCGVGMEANAECVADESAIEAALTLHDCPAARVAKARFQGAHSARLTNSVLADLAEESFAKACPTDDDEAAASAWKEVHDLANAIAIDGCESQYACTFGYGTITTATAERDCGAISSAFKRMAATGPAALTKDKKRHELLVRAVRMLCDADAGSRDAGVRDGGRSGTTDAGKAKKDSGLR